MKKNPGMPKIRARKLARESKKGRRITRMANRVTGGQSMRANGNRLAKALTSAKRSVRSVKIALRRSGVKVKRSSFGSKGG